MNTEPTAQQRAAGGALVAAASIAFGTLGLFSRTLRDAGLTIPQMLVVRFALGAAAMWALTAWRGEARRLPLKKWLAYAVMGLLYTLEAWLYFESSQRIPVALTVLLLYLYPALVTVGAWALWKQRPGRLGVFALVLSSTGIALAVGSPSGALDAVGVACGIGTALGYSVYVLMASRTQEGVPATLGTAWLMTVAAAVFGMASLSSPWSLEALGRGGPALAGLFICGTVPIPLLLIGVRRIGAGRAAVVSTIEPIAGVLCGAVFLGERLGTLQLVGGALVVVAVAALALERKPAQPAAAD